MRVIPAELQPILASGNHTMFYLLKIRKKLGIANFYCGTTHASNIVYGGDTYYSDGRILSTDSISLSSVVDRDTFKVALADPSLTMVSELDSTEHGSLTGADAYLNAGYLDSNSQPILTAVLPIYIGTVEAWGLTADTTNKGSITIGITFSSPMNNLDQKRFIELSKQAVRARNPADSCCDQLYEGSSAMTLRWGKRG
jgi:hypothetical protein